MDFTEIVWCLISGPAPLIAVFLLELHSAVGRRNMRSEGRVNLIVQTPSVMPLQFLFSAFVPEKCIKMRDHYEPKSV